MNLSGFAVSLLTRERVVLVGLVVRKCHIANRTCQNLGEFITNILADMFDLINIFVVKLYRKLF